MAVSTLLRARSTATSTESIEPAPINHGGELVGKVEFALSSEEDDGARRKKQLCCSGTVWRRSLYLMAAVLLSVTLIPPEKIQRGPPDASYKPSLFPVEEASVAESNDVEKETSNDSPPSSSREIASWLEENSETAGAILAGLMEKHLYSDLSEKGRVDDCRSKQEHRPRCFTGLSYNRSDETTANLPLEGAGGQKTVHQLRTIRDSKGGERILANLGTDAVCLPLMLAGAAVATASALQPTAASETGVVVEFGTFTGFTSRCIAFGLHSVKAKDSEDNLYYGFDTFSGLQNFKAITKSMPWIKGEPDFEDSPKASFLWLWRHAVDDVYPKAYAVAGPISSETVTPSRHWDDRPVAFLSVDSIKSFKNWNEQLFGFHETILPRGSIMGMMDFTYTDQPIFVYACLRHVLHPIYTSWCAGEHWIFVALRDLRKSDVCTCMKKIIDPATGRPSPAYVDNMASLIKSDIDAFAEKGGFTSNDTQYKCLVEQMISGQYAKIANNAESDRFWRQFQSCTT